MTLLSIEDLTVAFRSERGEATAIENVCLSLAPGEILGVVGESGSGKSVTALSIMGLLPEPAARIVGGRVVFEGQTLTTMPESRDAAYSRAGDRDGVPGADDQPEPGFFHWGADHRDLGGAWRAQCGQAAPARGGDAGARRDPWRVAAS